MGSGWSANDVPDLTGQLALVTGSNRGLGYATVMELAKKGCEVVMTARTLEKGNEAAKLIRQTCPNAKLHVYQLDLSSLSSVRACAKQFETQFDHLNVLINNAGIATTSNYSFIETEDHLELVWQTNYYAPFLFTNLLMNVLRAGAEQGVKLPSRVVMISSVTHAHGRNNIDPSQGLERVGRKSKGKKKCYEYPVSLFLYYMTFAFFSFFVLLLFSLYPGRLR